MPDDGSGMQKFEVESIQEFLDITGFKMTNVFDGLGMYMTCDGIPTKWDIKEGLFDSPGKTNGTIIVR